MGVVLGAIASFLGIFVAFCALAVVEGRLQGRESPNLETGMAIVYGLIGAALFPFWGWTSTLGLLAFLVAWAAIGAAIDRFRAVPAPEPRDVRGAEVDRVGRSGLSPATALGLLGALASREVQRRFIVRGTVDAYLVPGELVNDANGFLSHPLLGPTGSLRSVRTLAAVLDERLANVSLDGSTSNEALIERDPGWAALRSAARDVLEEMGADLEAWESEQLAGERPESSGGRSGHA